MQEADPTPDLSGPSRWFEWLRPVHVVGAVVATVVAVEHVIHGVRRSPAAYGGDFATEYLEHLRRIEYLALLRDLPPGEGTVQAWRALDRVEFPPLLVLLQHPIDLLLGAHPGVAVAMNLGWLALLAFGTVLLARGLNLKDVAPWAGILVLLMPGVWGPARTYYYDLPMLALLVLGTAACVACVQRPHIGCAVLGTLAFAGAELMKWEAVLYIAAALPAVLLVGALSREAAPRRLLGGLSVVALLGGAAGLVWAYVRRHPHAFEARFGQVVSLNQGQGLEGGAATIGTGVVQRLMHADIESWGFYPQWMTASSLGLVFVLLLAVATVRIHRMPRSVALGAPIAGVGTLVAVVGVSDIQEVRFLHPVLPWIAVYLAAGLGSLRGRRAEVGLCLAVVLGITQILAADYVRESDDSPLRTGVVDVPWPAQLLLGAGVSPLPASPGNQNGWRRPVDHEVNDAFALRTALAWVAQAAGGPATVAAHPLNRDLGRAEYAWSFWAFHRGEGLRFLPGRPIEDCDVLPESSAAHRSDFLVVDFLPGLLGGDPEGWCRTLECAGAGGIADIDPCGVAPHWVAVGAGWASSPAIPYRPRSGGPSRHLWVIQRASR